MSQNNAGGAEAEIRVGVIGGSGLGAAMAEQTNGGLRHDIDTPFGRPSDVIVENEWNGLRVFFLNRHGPGHLLNPSAVPYRANIFALKQLGVTHVLASGAVGSLREEYQPRQLVIPDQVIDKTSKRANTFYERAAVHVEFAEPFCPVVRRMLLEAAGEEGSGFGVQGGAKASAPAMGVQAAALSETRAPNAQSCVVHPRGCYVAMEGPAFSTRAESLMHRLWGGDLIGMTAMPEAKLAREAEIAYALVALVTDYDCWRAKPADVVSQAGASSSAEGGVEVDPFVLLKEIIANLEAATSNAVSLIRRTVARMASRREELQGSPALHALRLGIWSDKSQIPPEELRRLAPLWINYFK